MKKNASNVIGIPRESVIEMMLGSGLDPQKAIR